MTASRDVGNYNIWIHNILQIRIILYYIMIRVYFYKTRKPLIIHVHIVGYETLDM